MEKIEKYRQLVKNLLQARVWTRPGVETQTIFDSERDHYQLVNVGWSEGSHRVYGTVIHIDIKDGKIWVQWDGTENAIADELVEHGVPKSDIVIGFHSPYKRQFSDFAVG